MKRRGRTSIVETGFGAAGVRRRGRVRATAMPHAGFRQEEINVMTWSTVLSLLVTTVVFLPSAQPGRPVAPDSGSPRVVRLTIAPARLDAARSLPLLPGSEQQTDGDGAELYAKAVQALPQGPKTDQVQQWLGVPLDELPAADVQAILQQAKTSLELAGQGAKCRSCEWPPFQSGTMPTGLAEFRNLARLLCLRARLQIAQRQYDDAVGTIRTGLAMARHVGESPTVVQGMVGVAIAAMVLRCAEDMAQAAGSPNLYHAMQALPHPLIDLNQPISAELKGLDANSQYSEATRNMMRRQMESSFDRVRQLMNRLDGTVAALQYIEALRHHVATHDGSLPARLGDIADVELAADEKSFAYRLDESMATLEVSPPQGGRSKDAVRYEITVAH